MACLSSDSDSALEVCGHKPIRGVPPFGHSTQLRVFVDPDLLHYDGINDFVWAADGRWNDVFPIAPNDLVRASGAMVTDLKRV